MTNCWNLLGKTTFLLGLTLVLALPGSRAFPQEGKPPEPPAESVLPDVFAKSQPKTVDDLRAIQNHVRQLVTELRDSVVAVRVGQSQGSGVIVNKQGVVITAGHVIEKPNQPAAVVLQDGRVVKAVTLGINHGIDSGMLKITEPGDWPHAQMAPAGTLRVGRWCLSIGHPGGFIQGRLPVVRLGRILFHNQKVICTDCVLVGGDSGGPLFDMLGRVIGIHSRIGWNTTTNFHVPIAVYHRDWDRLAAAEAWGGRAMTSSIAGARPLLGVAGNREGKPCRVTQVFPGSAAERAGVEVGDVIVAFADREVDNFSDLAKLSSKKRPGEKVEIELRRGEKSIRLTVALGIRQRRLPGGPQEEGK